MTTTLQYIDHDHGRFARITLNRESKRNALDWTTLESLATHVEQLQTDEHLRALVLTGAGERAFTGGADLDVLASLTEQTGREFISLIHRANSELRALPVPVVCRINGHCIGAGLEIAVSCDLRVCVDTALLSMPEVQVGLPSVIEAALLPRLIGWGRTSQLLYTGEPIDAATAASWGLVDTCVSTDELDQTVDGLVASICRAAPLAIRAQKRLMNEWSVLPLEQGISRGIDYLAEACVTGEPAQRIGALRANR